MFVCINAFVAWLNGGSREELQKLYSMHVQGHEKTFAFLVIQMFTFVVGCMNFASLGVRTIMRSADPTLVDTIFVVASLVSILGIFRLLHLIQVTQLYETGLRHGRCITFADRSFVLDYFLVFGIASLMLLVFSGVVHALVVNGNLEEYSVLFGLISPMLGIGRVLHGMSIKWDEQDRGLCKISLRELGHMLREDSKLPSGASLKEHLRR
eukprot:SRR837773.17107.p1 GENE.SRR837773.17107~~SRR837773.17107.p1  ORF type:complete len:229 (-),score=60.15 SRR837773.17107:298-927(-)